MATFRVETLTHINQTIEVVAESEEHAYAIAESVARGRAVRGYEYPPTDVVAVEAQSLEAQSLEAQSLEEDGIVVCQWCAGEGCQSCGWTGRGDTHPDECDCDGCADSGPIVDPVPWFFHLHAVTDAHDGAPLLQIDSCPKCGTGPWAGRTFMELVGFLSGCCPNSL